MASQKSLVKVLLDEHGRTFSDELGVHVEKNTPSPLFQTLVFALLASSRISHDAAMSAAKALFDAGWTTPEKMHDATWRQRTDTLNAAGYARYDESTSRMLGDTTELLLEDYDGDLRKLRHAADRDPDRERERLTDFKGIGDVGASIFMREVQAAWDECYPFVDKRALRGAKALGLGNSADDLTGHVSRKDFPRFVAALVRVDLTGDADDLKNRAA